MRWLADCSPSEIAAALTAAAPDLSGEQIVLRESLGEEDPTWWVASAVVGGRFVAKFAWSQPAALRLAHEIRILTALLRNSAVPFLPEVVASSTDPLLLVTRRVPGTISRRSSGMPPALFDVVDTIDRDSAGRQLAGFLAGLHDPDTLEHVQGMVGELPPALLPPATTSMIRERFGTWIRPDQIGTVRPWCDWADDVLASPGQAVLVHADLHGGNQVWEDGQLRVLVDFETAGIAEPEYDLRTFPGTGQGVELMQATVHHYRQISGRHLSTDRVMAWHLRTVLGDALWRSEAGVHLPDHRTPTAWVDDLSARFGALGIDAFAPY